MTTIKRFLIVVSVLTLVLNQVFAERVSQEDAAAVANNFMNAGSSQSGLRKSGGKRMVLKNTAAAAENQYYIYENADGEGWVMVAANDVVKPILAYSKTGTFNTDKMPSNVSHWLGHYDKFIKKLETEGVTQTEEVAEQWKGLRKAPPSTPAGTIVVGPLIQTTWDQTAPYNNLCPGTGTYENGGSKAATGCVATAMAQVMNYWQWPITGNGSRTYQPKDPTSETIPKETSKRYGQQTADFGSTTYDWANMKNSYSGTSTSAQKAAVATLMFHCGVATDMMYGNSADGGSGTYTVNYNDWDWDDDEGECAQNAFVMFFRYKKSGLTGYIRDGNGGYPYSSWTDAAWTNMIKTELDKQHPIMYGGSGSAGGHSFICDGYDDQNYFHFNWGWSGQNDGWFTLSNLVPGSGGAGGGGYNFSQDQDAIIGIVPDKPDITITWSVQGTETSKSYTYGSLWSPTTEPSDCASGMKFVGWTEQSSISGGTKPSDLFASGTKMVTETKKYYAVYATAGSGSTPESWGLCETVASVSEGTYVITWNNSLYLPSETTASQNPAVGSGISESSKSLTNTVSSAMQWTFTGNNTDGFTISHTFGSTTYYLNSTNTAQGISVSTSNNTTWKVSLDGTYGMLLKGSDAGTRYLAVYNSATWRYYATGSSYSGTMRLYKQTGGSGTSYSDYSLICSAPCSNTPTMSFSAPTTVAKTTADGSFTKTVTISGKGSGQTVAYSSSDETVATVNSSGVVTLKGKIGSTTITASVEANGTYCAASASYTLNVTAAPINVTLYYNGTSVTFNDQTSPYTLPSGTPYNAAMCSGDWTFAGWYGSAYSKSTDAPSYIAELNATGSAYAVYTTTETSGSGGAGGSVTITTSTANIPTSYGSANTFTEYTLEGYKFKIQQMYLNGGKLQWRAAGNSSGTGTMYNNETFPGKITSIVLTYNSSDANKNFTVKVGDSANPSSGTSITPSISGGVYTFDCSSANADYFVLTNGSGAGYLDQIVINYGGGSTSTTYYATSPDCAPTTTYTVTWKACGEVFKSETYAEGAALVLPDPAPEDNAGKSFYGWTETEHHTGASAPADAFTTAGSKTVTSDVTYYAIYY
ncbi:MAG: C10 family peptidase [Paludibacteraceae bacterium]|nr:C10 family peptidase [Paludibacteraceae bacterium]